MVQQPEQSDIPIGTEFTVYWCPRCEVQCERAWHLCQKGPPLIPQLDEETQCVRTTLVYEPSSSS